MSGLAADAVRQRLSGWGKSAGLVIVWLVLATALSLRLPETFPTARNFETIVRQTIIEGFATVGMTFVIIVGAIDLSVGSLVALVTVVTALALNAGLPPFAAALAAIASGGLAGVVNGILTNRLRVGAFIVTLATLLAYRGVAKGLAGEKTVPSDMTWLAQLTESLPPERKWMVLPIGGWLLVAGAAGAAFILSRTVFGRNVVATGANEKTAELCGIKTDAVRLGVFLLAGLLFGMAGLMQFSRLTVGDPTVAGGLELRVIAAVVIGGASLAGGEGSIFGSLVGAVIMTTIATGASQLEWPNWVQEIVTGAIIVAAVAFDRYRHRKQES